jgi:hypothetical protein
MLEVIEPDVEHWEDLLKLWLSLRSTPNNLFKIDGGVEDLKTYFKLHLTSPFFKIWMVRQDKFFVGFVIASLGKDFRVREGMLKEVGNLFIRAVYVLPSSSGEVTMALQEHAEAFARKSGCEKLFGNCRLNFPTKAAEKKYGWKPVNIIMEKELN